MISDCRFVEAALFCSGGPAKAGPPSALALREPCPLFPYHKSSIGNLHSAMLPHPGLARAERQESRGLQQRYGDDEVQDVKGAAHGNATLIECRCAP